MKELNFPLLKPGDIEAKVKQVTKKGAVLLLYKTARTDMRLLDETVGPGNWKDSYREVKDNLYCTIYLYDEEKKEWVGKEDCGIESRKDNEGNQKKGEASDAFKRAGVKWGIGRELYTAPFIFATVPTEADGKSYVLQNRFMKFKVSEIEYDDTRSIAKLTITDQHGNEWYRFDHGRRKQTNRQGKNTGEQNPNVPVQGSELPIFTPTKAVCSDCGASLTQAVLSYSKNRFGKPLCRECQKKQ